MSRNVESGIPLLCALPPRLLRVRGLARSSLAVQPSPRASYLRSTRAEFTKLVSGVAVFMAPQPSPIGFVVVGNTTSPHESLDAAPLQPCTVGDSLAALFTLCPELARLATGSLDKPEDCTLPTWICLRYGLQLLHPDEAQDWNVEIGLHYYNPSMLASAIHSVITSGLFRCRSQIHGKRTCVLHG